MPDFCYVLENIIWNFCSDVIYPSPDAILERIYIGDDKVVHFTRRGQEVGTGTVLDVLLVSSGPNRSYVPCPTCVPTEDAHGVVSSCLNCFLAGGILYRFEYAVSPALFLAKARGGTCTLAVSDPDDDVIHRAKYLLDNGFGCYNVFKNNCEDFTIYCKTGLLVLDQSTMGQSGQAVSIIGGPLAAVLSTPLRLVTTNIYGMAATAVGVYCASRYAADIGMRRDVVKVPVEDLTRRLATGMLQVLEPSLPAAPALAH
ncbi:NC domain-containing protein-like protein [Perilla frutescens var. hirtella]|uniref:NC domain-containing protein-like protein n=1 Tax=Perilla frutescens var. hirtella TaxID=608512 RepID=A0AAD4JAL0_PERFH|nr:NC domain-containing protein-like protein [Perilla frutescens var. hirtella]KAH6806174.1 NC domain-containing protein-like protein [Perilla frutescens var. frutescens]KAH6830197.1 NC domain-containing protein-like protein [Perilla frutescens var. hirtella]